MTITHLLLDEPELEFGDGGRHIDPRLGLLEFGPLQPILGDRISLGVIGTADTVEGFERWMDRVKQAIPGASQKQPNLMPPFPGLGNDNPFRCQFDVSPTAKRVLPRKDIAEVVGIKNHQEAVREAVRLFADHAAAMLEGSDKPDVIIAALPFELIMRVVNDVSEGSDGDEDEGDNTLIDFRDLLK